MSLYDFGCNIFGYTSNERKRDEYKEVVTNLDNYLTTLSTNISECKDNYKGFEDVHATDNGTNSYGVAIDIFKKKSVEIHAQNLVCIRALDNAYDIVKTERDLAQSIYEKYVSAVAEDERLLC